MPSASKAVPLLPQVCGMSVPSSFLWTTTHGRLCDPGNDEAVSSPYFLSAFASYAQHVNSPVVCLRIEDFE
jgi:hypothetical protein